MAKIRDTTLHFCDGKLYVREAPFVNGKQSKDWQYVEVTEQVAQAIIEYINPSNNKVK